jgi:hypothetical protein
MIPPQSSWSSPQMPLAIYREVEAHLRQVTGVQVEVLPQTSQQFEYLKSQAGGLSIAYTPEATEESQRRVAQILAYYGDRYAPWEPVQ